MGTILNRYSDEDVRAAVSGTIENWMEGACSRATIDDFAADLDGARAELCEGFWNALEDSAGVSVHRVEVQDSDRVWSLIQDNVKSMIAAERAAEEVK